MAIIILCGIVMHVHVHVQLCVMCRSGKCFFGFSGKYVNNTVIPEINL